MNKITTEILNLLCHEYQGIPEIVRPSCGSTYMIKNGLIHNGKPKYQCKSARQSWEYQE